ITASSTIGTCTPATQSPPPTAGPQVTCTIGTLNPGQSAVITVDKLEVSSPPDCIQNDLAEATDSNGSTLPLPAQATLPAGPNTTVNCSGMTVTKTANPSTSAPGGTVTYTISVKNNGLQTLTFSGAGNGVFDT